MVQINMLSTELVGQEGIRRGGGGAGICEGGIATSGGIARIEAAPPNGGP